MGAIGRRYLPYAAATIGHRLLKINHRTSERKIHASLMGLSQRLKSNADGTWCIPLDITEGELQALEAALSYITAQVIFEPEVLVDGFLKALSGAQLISKDEVGEHGKRLGKLIELYAVSAMHQSTILVGDGTSVPLVAGCSDDGKVVVSCEVAVPLMGSIVRTVRSLFITRLDAPTFCDDRIKALRFFSFPVEVDANGKLAPLN